MKFNPFDNYLSLNSMFTYLKLCLVFLVFSLILVGCQMSPSQKKANLEKASLDWSKLNHEGLLNLQKHNLSLAKGYFDQARTAASLCGPNDIRLGITQNNLAGVYEASQEYNEAINALYKTIEIAQINKNETLTLNAKYNLARMMVKVGDVKMALVLYKEVIQALKSSNKAFGLNIREIYNEYYDLYNKTQVKK